jgi:hypothetical protein
MVFTEKKRLRSRNGRYIIVPPILAEGEVFNTNLKRTKTWVYPSPLLQFSAAE